MGYRGSTSRELKAKRAAVFAAVLGLLFCGSRRLVKTSRAALESQARAHAGARGSTMPRRTTPRGILCQQPAERQRRIRRAP